MIIDCHGHYTTAPKALEAWRNQQVASIRDPSLAPRVADLKISDDELRESIEANQLKLMRERGSDMTIFSPRASFMAHHIGDFNVSSTWAAICNELCFRVSTLFPDYFIGAAMLPQSPGVDPKTVEITSDHGVLTIRGKREDLRREARAGYRRVERISGDFLRRFSLPDSVDSQNIKARSVHGVLEVAIPKLAQVQPHRIAVEAA